MKPHEAELSVVQFDKERHCLVEGTGRDQRMVAVLRNYEADDWERFLIAAPDMARALLALDALLAEDPTFTNPAESDAYAALASARSALQKAGVL